MWCYTVTEYVNASQRMSTVEDAGLKSVLNHIPLLVHRCTSDPDLLRLRGVHVTLVMYGETSSLILECNPPGQEGMLYGCKSAYPEVCT